MVGSDGTQKTQPIAARVQFIWPDGDPNRGAFVYSDTSLAMAIQCVDDQEELERYSYQELKVGNTVVVEGDRYRIERIEITQYNFDLEDEMFSGQVGVNVYGIDDLRPYNVAIQVYLEKSDE